MYSYKPLRKKYSGYQALVSYDHLQGHDHSHRQREDNRIQNDTHGIPSQDKFIEPGDT